MFADEVKYLLKSMYKTSVIWQKGESQNGGNKNTKHAKFSEKRTFLTHYFFTLFPNKFLKHVFNITKHVFDTILKLNNHT